MHRPVVLISYKYGLYFTDTALICTNSTHPVVVWQIEKLIILATLIIQHETPGIIIC
jgi:hypothetical protein